MSVTPPRRRSAVAPVAALLVLLVLAGLAAWWWLGYTRSPQYAVGRIATAVAERDYLGFQRYVDVDAVVRRAVDESVEQALPDAGGPAGDLARRLAERAKPELVREGTETVRGAVEGGAVQLDAAEAFLAPTQVRGVERIGDDEAVVTVALNRPGEAERTAVLRMRRSGDTWRVVAVENALELVRAYGLGDRISP